MDVGITRYTDGRSGVRFAKKAELTKEVNISLFLSMCVHACVRVCSPTFRGNRLKTTEPVSTKLFVHWWVFSDDLLKCK